MWDVFKDWIFDCIAFFANFLGDWGLAIIVITVIFRLLVAPIMHKQIKSTFQMQKVQPLMQEIQKKFADDPPHAFPGNGQMKPEQLEIARLRREVIKLKAERDILKEAAAYFAKESL